MTAPPAARTASLDPPFSLAMTDPSSAGWRDAERVAALLAMSPLSFGGVVLRAGPGPVREAWCARLTDLLGSDAPIVRLPVNAGPERLFGELDIGATLSLGRAVRQTGLLTAADGGILIVPSAGLLDAVARHALCAALDTGRLQIESDGCSARAHARLALIAFDEGWDTGSAIPGALTDRIALHADLTMISYRHITSPHYDQASIRAARTRLPDVHLPEPLLRALCEATLALGIPSGRAERFACACARALAALDRRTTVTEADLTAAARLVLIERAQAIPEPADDRHAPGDNVSQRDGADVPGTTTSPPEQQPPPVEPGAATAGSTTTITDTIVEIVRHEGLQPDILSRLGIGRQLGSAQRASGRQATRRLGDRRGRPAGVGRFQNNGAGRINLLASLRAAAPWQKLRRDARARHNLPDAPRSLIMQRDDLRVSRYRERLGTTILFLVDASGSTALGRLAEAKGAVEMLLFESYRRRDQVALVSFRGEHAETRLPPTKSLVRAKRELAALPGGGATPLATGLIHATGLGCTIEAHGRRPVLVLITDGRPNIDAAGKADRASAKDDALAAARRLAARRWSALVFDVSARPNPPTEELSRVLGATYQHLPYMTSKSVAAAVRANIHAAATSR